MIIDVDQVQPGLEVLQNYLRQRPPCFFCHEPLDDVAVFWMGDPCDLWCHPACTVELMIRLMRDVHEAECSSHVYITSRTTPELRRRLVAEEMQR